MAARHCVTRLAQAYIFLGTCLLLLYLMILRKPEGLSWISSIFSENADIDAKDIASAQCHWKFDHYSPSAWEVSWHENITDLQNRVCSTLKTSDQRNKSIRALTDIMSLQKVIFNGSSHAARSDELFSKIYYRLECSGKVRRSNVLVSQFIEPLIGLLRDPLTICSHANLPVEFSLSANAQVQSKRFLLLGPSAPYQRFHGETNAIAPWLHQPGSQKILLDVGCTYFNGHANASLATELLSTRWFYEYFQSIGLHFDRIVGFEFSPYSPATFWQQLPADLIGRFTFINVGVETTGKFNPWSVLKNIAKPNDYVIVKLDIDTPALENSLIRQILNDSALHALIDEMFFEMHVSVEEMQVYWGPTPGTLKDSYVLFTELRRLGIRMHSWP